MSATLRSDRTIDFDKGNSLLSMRDIANAFIAAYALARESQSRFEHNIKVAQLRQSCGVENPPLRIRRPNEYFPVLESDDGKADDEKA